jgi:hypothetical protein
LSQTPLDTLRDLTHRACSGEFICATASGEVHVYLQNGRVAWATASQHPFAFIRFVKERSGVNDDALRRLVDECRRENLPFGETLISRGLATCECVKGALEHQARQSISALSKLPSAETIFLERRRFAEYRGDLTFRLSELAPEQPEVAAGLPGREGLAAQLLASIEGASWVEVLEDDRCVDAAPGEAGTSRVPPELVRSTLGDDTDFVAVRGALGSIIGVRLAGARRSLWCQLSAASTFGAAVLALRTLKSEWSNGEAEQRGSGARVPAWELGARTSHDALSLKGVLEHAPEVLAAMILGEDLQPLFGIGGEVLECDACVELFRRRAPAFAAPFFLGGERAAVSETDVTALGFSYRGMVTGERNLWCFGAEIYGEAKRTLWLVTDRRVPQGVGWACLAAVRRGLGYRSFAPTRQAG